MDDLGIAQGTAYSYVNRLVDAGVVDITDDEQPRLYATRKIDLTVTTSADDRPADEVERADAALAALAS